MLTSQPEPTVQESETPAPGDGRSARWRVRTIIRRPRLWIVIGGVVVLVLGATVIAHQVVYAQYGSAVSQQTHTEQEARVLAREFSQAKKTVEAQYSSITGWGSEPTEFLTADEATAVSTLRSHLTTVVSSAHLTSVPQTHFPTSLSPFTSFPQLLTASGDVTNAHHHLMTWTSEANSEIRVLKDARTQAITRVGDLITGTHGSSTLVGLVADASKINSANPSATQTSKDQLVASAQQAAKTPTSATNISLVAAFLNSALAVQTSNNQAVQAAAAAAAAATAAQHQSSGSTTYSSGSRWSPSYSASTNGGGSASSGSGYSQPSTDSGSGTQSSGTGTTTVTTPPPVQGGPVTFSGQNYTPGCQLAVVIRTGYFMWDSAPHIINNEPIPWTGTTTTSGSRSNYTIWACG